ncbi:MAG: transketolase C-terminal domain-containing protein [Christensenellales bacterium]
MSKLAVMEGSLGVAHAIRQAAPNVVSAYPISPQTHIVEEIAKFFANGEMKGKYIRVDSEFSAASVVYGASATGVRSYTASSSQGLLLMNEVIYAMAGTRLPVVLTGVNRTVSAPITIKNDLQDTMSLRDTGAIQIYVENNQEAYATHLQAFKLAEDHEILLPVIVCMDGWTLTHSYEPIRIEDQEKVNAFLPPFKPYYRLDTKKPLTYGAISVDSTPEFRYMMHFAQLEKALDKIDSIALEYKNMFGDYFGGTIDTYKTEDAEIIMVAMGSMVGTLRNAVDVFREKGQKIGIVKLRAYRPFPGEALYQAVKKAKAVCVLDKALSVGQGGPVATDFRAYCCNKKEKPMILSCITGLGGRDVDIVTAGEVVSKATEALATGIVQNTEYIQIKREYL